MKTETEMKEALAEVLERARWEMSQRERRVYTWNQAAVKWEMAPNTLSRLVNKESLPDTKNYFLLVKHVGNPVCDALDRPRMLPDDPILRKIAEQWPRLTQAQRVSVLENMEELVKEQVPSGVRETA